MGNLNSIPINIHYACLSNSSVLGQPEWIKLKRLNKEAYQKIKDLESVLESAKTSVDVRQNNIISLQKFHIEILQIDNWNYGLHIACKENNIDLVNLMIKKGANDWNEGLYGACEGNSVEAADLMIKKGANNWNRGLYSACGKNSIELVKIMIKNGANNFDDSLECACKANAVDAARLMIENGANDWNHVLECACIHNAVGTAMLMIDQGIDVNLGLYYSCEANSIDIANKMIEKGANNFDDGLSGACKLFSINEYTVDTMELMIEKGASQCFHCNESMKDHLQMIFDRRESYDSCENDLCYSRC